MIDMDHQSDKRDEVIEDFKDKYGHDKVLNICTYSRQATASTITDVIVGYGGERNNGMALGKLLPDGMTIEEAVYGKKPCKQFIDGVYKYANVTTEEEFEIIVQAMLDIEGVISGMSQHAGGVCSYPDEYWKYTACIKTSNGLVTQFDMDDVEYMGGIKYDFLCIECLTKIRAAYELLLKYGLIEDKGSLKETYCHYFHPDKLDLTSPEIFDLLQSGEIYDCFQFSTKIGMSALKSINARTFEQLCAVNTLIRLTVDGSEQPKDKFKRFRDNPQLWEEEMDMYNITEDERNTLKTHIGYCYGVCSTQEDIMTIISDPKIGNYDETQANNYRKMIAKKNMKKLNIEKEIYLKSGMDNGNRKEFLEYVWTFCFEPAFGLIA